MFTRSGGEWSQQSGELKGSAEVGAGEFGKGVALSSDGNTALMGGPGDNTNVGAAWVFTRSGGEWTQQGAKLTGSGETGEGEFGTSVALSSEATTALIGAAADNTKVGAAWVFTRSDTIWTQQGAKLTANSGEEIGEGLFGFSVALSSEGNTALIGAPGDNINVGAAWVFVNTAPTVVTGSGVRGRADHRDVERDREPRRRERHRMQIRIRHDERLRIDRVVRLVAGVGQQPGRRVRGDLGPHREHHLPLQDLGDQRGRHEQRLRTRRSKRCPNAPTVVTKPASPIAQTDGDAERHGQPQRRGSDRLQIRIRHHDRIRIDRVVRLAAGVRVEPGSGFRGRHGPHREHDLPLQDLRHQLGRHEQRRRRNRQNAAERPDGRDETGVARHPDHGDPERDRQPQQRRSQRLQIRIRHDGSLRIDRIVLPRCRGPGRAR